MTTQPALKCPDPFVSVDALTCAMPCPSTRNFERVGSASAGLKCAYRSNPEISVNLNTVAAASFEGTTIEQVRAANPNLYTQFMNEKDRFNREIALAYGRLDSDQVRQDAFRDLQAAENVRDESPEAYQQARIRYYTLTRGEGWLGEEERRVMNSEVMPKVAKYLKTYEDINTRLGQQQQTMEVVKGVKDKILSMRDDFSFSVNTFTKQIGELRNQINIEKHAREKDNVNWINTLLNILIVFGIIILIVTVARKYLLPRYAPAYMSLPLKKQV